jgi:ABC-2 type transport system ATP-binding protein
MSIQVSNLTKHYGSQVAVNHIDFQLNKGEIIGFLGPNGAGKSTTLKMITGYVTPTEGTIWVNGINTKEKPLAAKALIGYLPESNALYTDLYVTEYLSFIGKIHGIKAITKAIERVIDLTGLGVEKHKKIHQLSKGYKQRVGLAAALIHDPEILLLDEPTSGFDPNQIIEIRKVIKEQGTNKTVLFSSHILQEVSAICNRVIIINKGNIVANNTLEELSNQTQTNSIQVQFAQEVPISVLVSAGFSVAEQTNSTGNYFIIQSANIINEQKALMEFSLKHNYTIVQLQRNQSNLEDIFQLLTKTQ